MRQGKQSLTYNRQAAIIAWFLLWGGTILHPLQYYQQSTMTLIKCGFRHSLII